MTISSDKTPPDDLLGRKSFALEISKGLKIYTQNFTDPITISITGEWGSGKTTLLHYIKEDLKIEGAPYKIIEFNPWLFYKNESIRDAFLIQLALALKSSDAKITQASKKILEFVKAFRWVKYITPVAGNAQESLETFVEQLSKDDNISSIKEEVEKILIKSKKKIILFIDDIDRLMPDQITELFQTISLVADFSNIIYIIAFDRQIVINALNVTFSNHGQEYLEKIVQVDYEVPRIRPEVLNSLFSTFLKKVEENNDIRFESDIIDSLWSLHGLNEYFDNLRDYKRYFNSLTFRFPPITGEVNHVDFLVIEAIRIFDYETYSNFYNMCKTNFRRRDIVEKLLTEDQFKTITSPASDILKAILPNSTLDAFRKDVNLKRLSDFSYFDRYFSLITGANDIPEKQVKDFFQQPSSRKWILKDALQYGRMQDMIKRLSDNAIRKHYGNYDYGIIENVIRFFNTQPSLLEKECNAIADMIINLICCAGDQNTFLKRFFKSFSEPASHPSYLHFYFFHYMRRFSQNGNYFRADHYMVFDQYYKANLPDIEKGYLPFFKSLGDQIPDNRLTISFPFIKYLYQCNYVEIYPELYPALFNKLLQDGNYIIYLGTLMVLLNEKNYEVFRYNWVENQVIFPGLLFQDYYKALKEMNPEHLDKKSEAIRKHILAIDISKFPEKTSYPKEYR